MKRNKFKSADRNKSESTLDDHVLLHDEERREHEEGVDRSRGRPIGHVIHGHTPRQVVLALVRAELVAAEPLLSAARICGHGRVLPIRQVRGDGGSGVLRDEEAATEEGATEEAQTQDDLVLVEELGVLGQGGVDTVREVGLVADVDEA